MANNVSKVAQQQEQNIYNAQFLSPDELKANNLKASQRNFGETLKKYFTEDYGAKIAREGAEKAAKNGGLDFMG